MIFERELTPHTQASGSAPAERGVRLRGPGCSRTGTGQRSLPPHAPRFIPPLKMRRGVRVGARLHTSHGTDATDWCASRSARPLCTREVTARPLRAALVIVISSRLSTRALVRVRVRVRARVRVRVRVRARVRARARVRVREHARLGGRVGLEEGGEGGELLVRVRVRVRG